MDATVFFAETGTGNVVGAAVVNAVMLEKAGAKGPRLLVDAMVSEAVRASEYAWLLDSGEGAAELLWLLPPDAKDIDLAHLRPVCVAAAEALLATPVAVAEHYIAYVDLVLRSLLRLKEVDAGAAKALAQAMNVSAIGRRLESLSTDKMPLEHRAMERLADLTR